MPIYTLEGASLHWEAEIVLGVLFEEGGKPKKVGTLGSHEGDITHQAAFFAAVAHDP